MNRKQQRLYAAAGDTTNPDIARRNSVFGDLGVRWSCLLPKSPLRRCSAHAQANHVAGLR